jgi:8-oxo-dGTP diphosphatase
MLHVACAVIEKDGLILAARRSPESSMPGKWEFPGGKLEKGESPEDCLRREIREELGLGITLLRSLSPVSHGYTDFDILLYPFLCRIDETSAKPLSEFPRSLQSHSEIRWDTPENLQNLDWAEADIPVLKEIMI